MIRLILLLNGVLFLAVGLAFALRPVSMTGYVSISLGNATAISDVWAVYGGLELGVGCFLCLCAKDATRYQMGLLACLCCFGGLAGVRGISIWFDGATTAINLVLWCGELVGLASALWGLSLLQKEERDS